MARLLNDLSVCPPRFAEEEDRALKGKAEVKVNRILGILSGPNKQPLQAADAKVNGILDILGGEQAATPAMSSRSTSKPFRAGDSTVSLASAGDVSGLFSAPHVPEEGA